MSSAESAQKVVKVKFGQIHLNEVCVGALYLDIHVSCWILSPMETICKKSQEYEKCFAMFCISIYPSQS